MADEKKPAKKSRGEDLYDSPEMTSAREKRTAGKPAAHKAGGDTPSSGGEMLKRHAGEREGLRVEHEGQRRNEHNRQRDEHRSMDARHESEHAGMTDHAATVGLHRTHEHEKHGLVGDHEKRHKDMAERHHHERHTLNMKHEAELLGAAGAGAGPAGAAGAPAPEPPAPAMAAAGGA